MYISFGTGVTRILHRRIWVSEYLIFLSVYDTWLVKQSSLVPVIIP